jgi:hypothetical protein
VWEAALSADPFGAESGDGAPSYNDSVRQRCAGKPH